MLKGLDPGKAHPWRMIKRRHPTCETKDRGHPRFSEMVTPADPFT